MCSIFNMKYFLKQIMLVSVFVLVSTSASWGNDCDDIMNALRKADAAKNIKDAKALARMYQRDCETNSSSSTEIYNYLVREGYLGLNPFSKEERLEQRLELMEERLEKMEDCLIFKLFCN